MDRVGVIGLGKMGLPIARNLMVRGFHVTGYRRSGSPELAREGGTVAASAAEVAAEADVILSIVPTADDVEEIIAGPAGTLVNLKPGTIHIEMSTRKPSPPRKITRPSVTGPIRPREKPPGLGSTRVSVMYAMMSRLACGDSAPSENTGMASGPVSIAV